MKLVLCNFIWKLTIYPEKNKRVDEHQNRYWYEHRHRYILNLSSQGVLRNIFPFDGANLSLLCIFLFHLIFRRCLGAFYRATNSSSSWPRTRAMGKSQPLVGDQCMQIWEEGMGDNNNNDKSKTKILTILNWSTLFLSRCTGQLMKEQQGPGSLWSPDWSESGQINSNANWMGPSTTLVTHEYPTVLAEMYYQTERNGTGYGIRSWSLEITDYIFFSWPLRESHIFKMSFIFPHFSCVRIILKCRSS